MLDALWTAATGMLAQQTALDVTANNLANVNTVGYKAGRTAFQDLLYVELNRRLASRQGNLMGLGTAVAAVQMQMGQGSFQTTGRNLDVAITGQGFIPVRLPDGTNGFTKAGTLQVDALGQLTDANGNIVQPPINVPVQGDMNSFTITKDGTVTIKVNGTDQRLGQLQLAVFPNAAGLDQRGQNIYVPTVNSGQPQLVAFESQGAGHLEQGVLEMSNVSAVDEMTTMISTQRAYEAVAKVVTASDEMLQTANNLRR